MDTHNPFKTSHAIVIGIDRYAAAPLGSAVNDARNIARVLEAKHGYKVTLLTDQEAKASDLRAALGVKLKERVQPDDRVLIYFAGHGIADDADENDVPQGFLVPQDARTNDPGSMAPMAWLHDTLCALPCRHLLLILDCCFAGSFRWVLKRRMFATGPYTLYRERYERFVADPAWQVLTSAGADELASDVSSRLGSRPSDGAHSPFALALLRALEGDAPAAVQHGVITATGLYQYLRDEVDTGKLNQTPGISYLAKHGKGEFVFIAPNSVLDLPDAGALSKANNPYRGLQPFQAEHAGLFFGREAAADELRKLIDAQPFVLATGPSGSGKSSLVRAGLIPRLETTLWRVIGPVRPGADPETALAHALAADNKTIDLTAAAALLLEQNPGKRLLLVIDQFEELVTLANPDECQRALTWLRAMLSTHPDRFRVLITLRSDFEPQFDKGLLHEWWPSGRFLVPRMSRDELREIIEKPAAARVLFFESETLINRVLDEVQQMAAPLPLLSFVLSEWYLSYLKRAEFDRTLTDRDYQRLGGVAGALSNRANDEFQKLDPQHQATLRRILLRMVALDGTTATRRPALLSELSTSRAGEDGRVSTVLQTLSDPDVRLIMAATDAFGAPSYELVHDTFLNSWDRLRQWIRDSQEEILLRQRMAPDVRDWVGHNRPDSRLWDRNPNQASALAAVHADSWPNVLEAEYIHKSESKRKRSQRLRVALTAGVVLVLSALAIATTLQRNAAVSNESLAIQRENARATQQALAEQRENARATQESIAIAQRNEAQTQQQLSRSRELAALAQSLLGDNSSRNLRALILANEAAVITNTVEAETVLRRAVTRPYRVHAGSAVIGADCDVIQDVAAIPISSGSELQLTSPNGRYRLAIQSGRLTVTPLDGAPAFTRNLNDVITSVAFAPAGDMVALSLGTSKTTAGSVVVVSLADGETLHRLRGHASRVHTSEFSADGERLVTSGQDGAARVWRMSDGALLATLESGSELVHTATFSKNGKCVRLSPNRGDAQLWNVEIGKEAAMVRKTSPYIQEMFAFGPDGAQIAYTTAGEGVDIYDIESGQRRATNIAPDWLAVANTFGVQWVITAPNFSELSPPESNRMLELSVGPDGVRVFNTETKTAIAQMAHQAESMRFISSAHFAPNGGRIAISIKTVYVSARLPCDALIWNYASGEQIRLRGHQDSVNSARFSSDGLRVITASNDGTIRIWDARTGAQLSQIEVGAPLHQAAFSPDMRFVVAASEFGLHTFYARIGDLTALAKLRMGGQSLPCDERVRYLHSAETCFDPTPEAP